MRKTKISYIVAISGVIVVMLFSFVACNFGEKGEKVNSISFEEISLEFQNGSNLSMILKSKEELATLLSTEKFLCYVSPWESSCDKWERFDSEFFVDKALILYFAITSSQSVSYVLNNIGFVDNMLKLLIVGKFYGDTMVDMEGLATFVIAVNKCDIDETTSFIVDVRYEKIMNNKNKI